MNAFALHSVSTKAFSFVSRWHLCSYEMFLYNSMTFIYWLITSVCVWGIHCIVYCSFLYTGFSLNGGSPSVHVLCQVSVSYLLWGLACLCRPCCGQRWRSRSQRSKVKGRRRKHASGYARLMVLHFDVSWFRSLKISFRSLENLSKLCTLIFCWWN